MSMSDDIKKELSDGSPDEAARRRAEKIAAIRKSVRERSVDISAEDAVEIADEQPVEHLLMPENTEPSLSEQTAQKADADKWESSLAERIAKVKRSAKSKRNENILRELSGQSDAADAEKTRIAKKADIPEKAPEVPEAHVEPVSDETVRELTEELVNSLSEENAAPVISQLIAETPEQTAEEQHELSAEEIVDSVLDKAPVQETAEEDTVPEDVIPEEAVSEQAEKYPSHFAEEAPEEAPEVKAEEVPEKAEKPKNKKKKGKKKKKSFKEHFLGLFPQKKDSIGERIRKVVFLCSIAVIIVCGYMVSDYYLDLWKSKRINSEVKQIYRSYNEEPATQPPESENAEPSYIMLDAARKLLDINKDVAGFITIPDTQVGNVLMQSSNNDKYLNTKITGEESRAGEVFLDYRCHFDDMDEEGHRVEPDTDNLIIYGHNMGDDSMFGCLKYYERNYDYYGQHPIIELNSNYMRYKYKIFAFFIVDSEDKSDTAFDCWNKLNFNTEEEFYDFVNEAKKRTIRLNDVDVKYGDSLITLSTCNTLLGDRGRLIILARRVRDGEDELAGTQNSKENPNIKWPTLYYDFKSSAKKYDPNAEFVPYGPETAETAAAETETATEANTNE